MFPQLTPVVKNLLIVNIVFFIGSNLSPMAYNYLPVFYPDSPFFKIWQVITHMFMHTDLSHIFFNMFSLVMFGSLIEQVLGPKRFLNLYLLSGLGAWLLQSGVQGIELYNATGSFFPLHHSLDLSNLASSNPNLVKEIYTTRMLGASGAVYGILLSFAYLFPNLPLQFLFIPVPVKAKYMIGGFILLEIYMSISRPGDSVAHLAHVGGALFGYILLKVWGIKKGLY